MTEDKEKKYYESEIAKLVEEDSDTETEESDDENAEEQPILQASPPPSPINKDPQDNQVSDCFQMVEHSSGTLPSPNDSIDFVSETPSILIITEKVNDQNNIMVPPDKGHENHQKGDLLDFHGLESPNSIAPAWQNNRPVQEGRKGGGKQGGKEIEVHLYL